MGPQHERRGQHPALLDREAVRRGVVVLDHAAVVGDLLRADGERLGDDLHLPRVDGRLAGEPGVPGGPALRRDHVEVVQLEGVGVDGGHPVLGRRGAQPGPRVIEVERVLGVQLGRQVGLAEAQSVADRGDVRGVLHRVDGLDEAADLRRPGRVRQQRPVDRHVAGAGDLGNEDHVEGDTTDRGVHLDQRLEVLQTVGRGDRVHPQAQGGQAGPGQVGLRQQGAGLGLPGRVGGVLQVQDQHVGLDLARPGDRRQQQRRGVEQARVGFHRASSLPNSRFIFCSEKSS